MSFQKLKDKNCIADGTLCFWSWNDNLDKKEITCQMEDFAANRFSGVIVHARGGLRIPYMGDEWFDYYLYTVEEAKRLGLEVWIYDEDGWPSGFAGGKLPALGESFWMKKLRFSRWEDSDRCNIIAAWNYDNGVYHRIPPAAAESGSRVCWYSADKNYVDLLSKDTGAAFIRITHETYKERLGSYFGTVIKGVFTDEPQVVGFPWSTALCDAWERAYGSDIRQHLYMLWEETGEWQTFRAQYRSLISDLFYHAFTEPISQWCADNGLCFTGHFANEDGLYMQAEASSGAMRHYAAMQMPGIDHLGSRITSAVLSKQASSAANQFGKREVLSETFGGSGWETSFEDLCWIWGRQSVLGITKPCLHLSAYSITGRRKRDYPAFFSYQEPWWQQLPAFTAWMNRLNTLMKEGKRLVDCLVLSPLVSVCASYRSKRAQYYSAQYRELLENLLDIQLDCEIGDERLIKEYAEIRKGAFCIGDSAYRLVIVPDCLSLSQHTVGLLEQFAADGGMLLYIGSKPEQIDFQQGTLPEGIVVQNRRELLRKWAEQFTVSRPVTLRHLHDRSIKRGAILHTREIENGRRVHIWTSADYHAGEAMVRFEPPDAAPYSVFLIDAATGARQPLPVLHDESAVWVKAEIPARGNVVLELVKQFALPQTTEITQTAERISDCKVTLCDKNAFTLDYAQISLEHEAYTAVQPVIHLLQWMYEKREQYPADRPMKVRVKYRFACAKGFAPTDIALVVESEFVTKMEVNDKQISLCSDKWWIDKKFREYDIAFAVTEGDNTVTLHYELPRSANGTKTEGFESERNRFFFPVEPDSVYVKGDFDVITGDTLVNCGSFYRCEGQHFQLSPPTSKQIGCLTAQQALFYRGNVAYDFTIKNFNDNCRYLLSLVHANGVAAEIQIGAYRKVLLSLSEKVDITEALSAGNCTVRVLLLGHNRNLLGPHHHKKGMPAMVGPSTFMGNAGFEDFVSPEIVNGSTWTDSYSFAPFGCDGFCIEMTSTIDVKTQIT